MNNLALNSKYSYEVFRIIALCLFYLFFYQIQLLNVSAQGLTDVPELPEGTGVLPEASVSQAPGAQFGITIDATKISSYRNIIPRELIAYIRNSDLMMDAAKRLHYSWKFDDTFESKSIELGNKAPKIGLNNEISGAFTPSVGFIFGSPFQILTDWQNELRSKVESIEKGEQIKAQLAAKVLWNISSLWYSQKFLSTNFNLSWFEEDKLFRSSQAVFTRIYPHLLSSQDKSQQFFREKVSFTAPNSLKLYSWLSFRFSSNDEDMVWLASPATQKVRQLTGSNRSDGMAASSVSINDLLGWSGDVRMSEIKQVELLTQLVPFPNLTMNDLIETPDSCGSVVNAGTSGELWNIDGSRYSNAKSWVPVSAIYVPRQMWRIEMRSRDPYTLHGREVLYVDLASNLPIYRIVYDRAGRLWKIVIASFGLAANHDRTRKIPYPAWMIVLDLQKNRQYGLQYNNYRVCRAFPADVSLADFESKKLIPQQK